MKAKWFHMFSLMAVLAVVFATVGQVSAQVSGHRGPDRVGVGHGRRQGVLVVGAEPDVVVVVALPGAREGVLAVPVEPLLELEVPGVVGVGEQTADDGQAERLDIDVPPRKK
mgnify:CR=1 FL=1